MIRSKRPSASRWAAKIAVAAIATTAFFSLPAETQAQQPTLTFSAIPNQDETHLLDRFNKIAAYLSKELGVQVKYVPMKSYAAAVTSFRNNHVQLAWFGGMTGVQARIVVPGSVAIVQGEEDPKFVSYMIANSATRLKEMKTLDNSIRGKTFTFGSKASTSGRLMPEYFLRQHYKEYPEKVFSRVGFSGDHTKTIELVESGAYDIGVVDYTVYNAAVKNGKVDTKKVSIIWTSPPYPDYNWSIRGDVEKTFGPGFIKKVQDAFLKMKDPELLSAFPRKSFIAASNKDFQIVEDNARKLKLLD
ncbi:MAG: putative selenate ABC transporter substrate-binding protein [Rhizobiales bacterium]|nr:putative selenate ABC transporter substrate-binding protein [Hyphomicrobiales bacterium]